ncbi:MAG: hypothetical protein BWY89_00799 [Bacteroidetes bacterium ADurb.BinA012]|nr:MAG: hypothetical protein BWY89_00799 [Bacteroidetes bacterium ADurb.BinA012]
MHYEIRDNIEKISACNNSGPFIPQGEFKESF